MTGGGTRGRHRGAGGALGLSLSGGYTGFYISKNSSSGPFKILHFTSGKFTSETFFKRTIQMHAPKTTQCSPYYNYINTISIYKDWKDLEKSRRLEEVYWLANAV